jgi:hypothetical protein
MKRRSEQQMNERESCVALWVGTGDATNEHIAIAAQTGTERGDRTCSDEAACGSIPSFLFLLWAVSRAMEAGLEEQSRARGKF